MRDLEAQIYQFTHRTSFYGHSCIGYKRKMPSGRAADFQSRVREPLRPQAQMTFCLSCSKTAQAEFALAKRFHCRA
jgi:hypothetical protein